MVKGIVGAVIGGLAGALVWTLVGYFTGFEIGWIAWGIGALAGFGMAKGMEEETTMLTGVLAAVVALASVAGGKFAVVYLAVERAVSESSAGQREVSHEQVKLSMAGDVIEEFESQGKKLVWPPNMDWDQAEKPADFPKDVWAETEKRWSALTPDEQEARRADLQQMYEQGMATLIADIRSKAFVDSFAAWDALWALLAIMTAYKLGARGTES